MHVGSFIIRIYHDARLAERQIQNNKRFKVQALKNWSELIFVQKIKMPYLEHLPIRIIFS